LIVSGLGGRPAGVLGETLQRFQFLPAVGWSAGWPRVVQKPAIFTDVDLIDISPVANLDLVDPLSLASFDIDIGDHGAPCFATNRFLHHGRNVFELRSEKNISDAYADFAAELLF
jgi:hypothetical protein